MARQSIRAAIQRLVGEPFPFEHHRDGIGGPFHLFLEELVNTLVLGVIGPRVVPFHQDFMPLGGGQFDIRVLGMRVDAIVSFHFSGLLSGRFSEVRRVRRRSIWGLKNPRVFCQASWMRVGLGA